MGKNQRQRAAQKSRERQFLFEPPGAATRSSVGHTTASLGGLSLMGTSAFLPIKRRQCHAFRRDQGNAKI